MIDIIILLPSCIFESFLYAADSWKGFAFFSLFFAGIILISINCTKRIPSEVLKKNRTVIRLLSVFVQIFFLFFFVLRFRTLGLVNVISAKTGIGSLSMISLCVGAFAAICGFPFIYQCLLFLQYGFSSGSHAHITMHKETRTFSQTADGIHYRFAVFSILVSIIVITVCSQSSFLYPMNTWKDVNCFLTVAKAMMKGFMPYRDLFDHKGPVLYFFYGLASLLSEKSYIGVYFLEIITASFFLYYSGKTIRLFEINEYYSIIVLSAAVFPSVSFWKGGAPEELCLPFLAYAMYIGVKAVQENIDISLKNYFKIGFFIALVFWTKYSFIGFFLGWLLFFGIRELMKNPKRLFKEIGCLIIGFLIPTLGVLVFFLVRGALHDLFQVYFYDNIFLYSGMQNTNIIFRFLSNYTNGLQIIIANNGFVLLLILIGWFGLRKKELTYLHLCTFVCLFATVFLGSLSFHYYAFIFCPFAYGGAAVLGDMIFSLKEKNLSRYMSRENFRFRRGFLLCGAVFIWTACLFMSPNIPMIGMDKMDLPQYQFAEIIRKEENPTLLNYGFIDAGFYQASGVMPNCKAFCALNLPIQELRDLQSIYIEKGKGKFIVTLNELDTPIYQLEAQSEGYYLYKLVE